MAQYDTDYPPYDLQSVPSRRWPLASVMLIDLIIALIAVIVITGIVQLLFVIAHVSAQGANLQNLLQNPSREQLLQLIGADGVFVSLLIQNAIFLAIPVIRLALIRHESLATIGFRWQPLRRLVLIGFGLGIVVLIGNGLISSFFNSIGIRQNQAAQYPLFQGQYAGQALFFIGAAILAPVGEETLFRGYVFNAIRQTAQMKRWGLPLAYVVSALLFSIAHSLAATEGVIGLLVPTFLMGLALAWGMQRTGSLLPGIIAHSLNNSLALVALLYCINTPDASFCPSL